MESEGIDSKADTPSNRVFFLLGLQKMLQKCLLRASALSMQELHTLVPVFNVGTPILSVLISLTYDQNHFGFSTRLLPITLSIYFLCDDMIDLATEFLYFLKFDQSVFEFDILALRKSLSRFLILHFISCVIHSRLCLDLILL